MECPVGGTVGPALSGKLLGVADTLDACKFQHLALQRGNNRIAAEPQECGRRTDNHDILWIRTFNGSRSGYHLVHGYDDGSSTQLDERYDLLRAPHRVGESLAHPLRLHLLRQTR